MQFHPTTLYVAGSARALVTEAVRGEGGHLDRQERPPLHARLSTRTASWPRATSSAAASSSRSDETGHTHVYLDVRHLDAEQVSQAVPDDHGPLRAVRSRPDEEADSGPPVGPLLRRRRRDGRARATSVAGPLRSGRVLVHRPARGEPVGQQLAARRPRVRPARGPPRGQGGDRSGDTFPQKLRHDQPPSDANASSTSADVRSSLRSVMWRNAGIERDGDTARQKPGRSSTSGAATSWTRRSAEGLPNGDVSVVKSGWELQNLLTVWPARRRRRPRPDGESRRALSPRLPRA